MARQRESNYRGSKWEMSLARRKNRKQASVTGGQTPGEWWEMLETGWEPDPMGPCYYPSSFPDSPLVCPASII